MKNHLDRLGSLGSTANGAMWCLKALHPADPGTVMEGIPDQAAFPTVMLNYQASYTISPATGATGTWSFDGTLLPHPIAFFTATKIDSVVPLGRNYSFLNSQLLGSTHAEKMSSFRALAQRWRMCYAGVTVYQDGPDLSNQGTLTVCQSPIAPYRLNWCNQRLVTTSLGFTARPHIEFYSTTDMPKFSTAQTTPNTYLNQSKYGAYVPLKLTADHTNWITERDLVGIGQVVDEGVSPEFLPEEAALEIPFTAGVGNGGRTNWPFGSNGTDANPSVPAADGLLQANCVWTTGSSNLSQGGEVTSPLCNGTVAHISARNLSVATSYTFFIRMGFEVQVLPGTELTPMQRLSPLYDPMALCRYYQIAREFKDAYPADYNDLAKILEVISTALSAISPGLLLIPEVGPLLSGIAAAGGSGFGAASGWVRKRNEARKALPSATATPALAAVANAAANQALVKWTNSEPIRGFTRAEAQALQGDHLRRAPGQLGGHRNQKRFTLSVQRKRQ